MDWIRDHLWESWLVLSIVLVGIEILTLDLIFAMLAAGAVVGMIAALVGLPMIAQVLLALAAAAGSLALLRPNLVRRLHGPTELVSGVQALIGSPVQVLTAVGHQAPGRVKIGGDEWTAAPYDEFDAFEPGERAEVVEIRGATAYIRRI